MLRVRIQKLAVMSAGLLAVSAALGQTDGLLCAARSYLGGYDTPHGALQLEVIDGIAYVANGVNSFQIVDVSDPTAPFLLGEYAVPRVAWDLDVVDGIAYIVEGWDPDTTSGLVILDVSDPTAPELLSTFETPDGAVDIQVVDGIAYIVERSGLYVVDVSDPTQPVLLAIDDSVRSSFNREIVVVDGLAYLQGADVNVIDISNPASPVLLGVFEADGPCAGLDVKGTLAYISVHHSTYKELSVVDLSDPLAPQELGSVEVSIEGEVRVYGDRAYIFGNFPNPRDYFEVVDVSDPTQPELLGSFATPDRSSGVVVVDDLAYVAAYEAGLAFYDVSRVPGSPLVGSTPPFRGELGSIEVVGTFAYTCGKNHAGLQIYSVADPTAPEIWGYYDRFWVHDLSVETDTAFLAVGSNGLEIIDVSLPFLPRLISTLSTPGEAYTVEVLEGVAFVGCALPEVTSLATVDVSDPSSPALLGSIETPGGINSITVDGGIAYLGCGGGWFVTVDISDPTSPAIVAMLDLGTATAWVGTVADGLAYVGHHKSLQLIDVSDPSSPAVVGGIELRTYVEHPVVREGIAYTAAALVDVSAPGSPRWLGAGIRGRQDVQDFVVGDGLAYRVTGPNGLQVIDITDCPRCPGDWDDDGDADTEDVLAFLNVWVSGASQADTNGDGVVDTRDIVLFLNQWADGC